MFNIALSCSSVLSGLALCAKTDEASHDIKVLQKLQLNGEEPLCSKTNDSSTSKTRSAVLLQIEVHATRGGHISV